mgnify:CR=1 FL=1
MLPTLGLLLCAAVAAGAVAPSRADGLPGTSTSASADDSTASASPSRWTERFAREVDHRLDVPPVDQQRYLVLLASALGAAGGVTPGAQAYVLVDRSPRVQAAMVVLRGPDGGWTWLGATAVSTGKPGRFEHFVSPLGVYRHTPANPDFRALGTFNKNHIRGYGTAGRRVFDFGWQQAERGWGEGGRSTMRLQMHATDPDRLELRLGSVDSEGCIRIPAMLNVFLDQHGVLDADYEAALAAGTPQRVLRPAREPIPWPGRYLVIVDSQVAERPAWSPPPGGAVATVKARR